MGGCNVMMLNISSFSQKKDRLVSICPPPHASLHHPHHTQHNCYLICLLDSYVEDSIHFRWPRVIYSEGTCTTFDHRIWPNVRNRMLVSLRGGGVN
jgi:hypothetical protein